MKLPIRILAALALPLAAFAQQRILSPAGPAGASLARLGWFVLILSLVVLGVMWLILALVLTRPRGSLDEHEPADTGGGQNWIFIGGFAFPAAVLAIMYIAGLDSMSHFPLSGGMNTKDAEIRIVGHQWWWELQYLGGPLNEHFTTANEIHIPAGRTVDIDLASEDVIHSFWVPALHGKVDLIPGQMNRIRVEASHPGVFRGQCAEFCGAEHAKMIISVVAETPEDYNRWLARMRQPGAVPSTDEQTRGQDVFLSGGCSLCHTIDGTLAAGTVGPNLTHIGSRRKIAANLLDNNTANLMAWVTHARSLKPAVVMPNMTQFTGDQLRELVVYLESLK
jgi:cytochrome c oxidase subunit 2